MTVARRVSAALVLLACFAATSPALAAWPRSPINSGVSVMPGQTLNGVNNAVPDGAGGAFVLMTDLRSGLTDVYLQRITAQGTVSPGWPTGGFPVCTDPSDQQGISLVPDGFGGVIIGWLDFRNGGRDIYAQRVTGSGLVSPGWPANGLAVSTLTQFKNFPAVAPDGLGGAFLVWEFNFGPGDIDIYGAHVTAAGAVASSGGLYTPSGPQKEPHIAPDNTGGFYVAFIDSSAASDFDVKVGHYNSSMAPIASPTLVCNAPRVQNAVSIMADGSGGLWLTWQDDRDGPFIQRVFATHVGSNAVSTAGWVFNGTRLGDLASEYRPTLTRDAADGAYFAWEDYRLSPASSMFAQHMSRSGTVVPPWPTYGAQISTAPLGYESIVKIVPDGTGGIVATWFHDPDNSISNETDVYAQRMTANATIAPHWPVNGAPVCIAPYLQSPYGLVPDSLGGAISLFSDQSGLSTSISKAQRIDRFGALGNAEPHVVSVRDVPLDNGGSVKITWDASYLDADPGYDIGSYWIWRATPISAALQAVRGGAHWATDATREPQAVRGRLFSTEGALAGTAWEYVGSQPASAFARYSYIAPTLNDSTGTFHPFTTFMVQARAAASGAYWGSSPDSGLSVDNVAPSMPAPFSGTYSGGVASMVWGASPQSDVVGYVLYRAVGPGFTPGPSNFVSQTASLTYPDPAATRYWYKVAAIDAHGNVSPYALAYPTGTTGVDDGPRLPLVLALHPVSPNPSREQATIAFDLPRDANVTLDVFDLAGRRVRSLVGGAMAAGVHRATWDGRDGDGHALGAGLYLITMDAEGRRLRQRFVLVR